jgi:hypothetical protein
MTLGTDPKVIKDYIQPQFDHYFWNNELDPDYKLNAMRFWEE